MKESNRKIADFIGHPLYNFLKRLKFRFTYYSYFSSLLQRESDLLKSRESFYSMFVEPGDLCFDIGANIGNRIIPLLSNGAIVVAVEPQELCTKFLKRYFKKKITVVKSAVGSAAGSADMHLCDETTISSLSNEWINAVKKDRFKHNNWDRMRKVAVTTLDQLIKVYGKPRFIKIDVEGYELEVLRGLSEEIDLISFEYTVPELLSNANNCLREFKRISPYATCNYSVGENTKFELDDWLSIDDMLAYSNESTFVKTNFGDVYVKNAALLIK